MPLNGSSTDTLIGKLGALQEAGGNCLERSTVSGISVRYVHLLCVHCALLSACSGGVRYFNTFLKQSLDVCVILPVHVGLPCHGVQVEVQLARLEIGVPLSLLPIWSRQRSTHLCKIKPEIAQPPILLFPGIIIHAHSCCDLFCPSSPAVPEPSPWDINAVMKGQKRRLTSLPLLPELPSVCRVTSSSV